MTEKEMKKMTYYLNTVEDVITKEVEKIRMIISILLFILMVCFFFNKQMILLQTLVFYS